MVAHVFERMLDEHETLHGRPCKRSDGCNWTRSQHTAVLAVFDSDNHAVIEQPTSRHQLRRAGCGDHRKRQQANPLGMGSGKRDVGPTHGPKRSGNTQSALSGAFHHAVKSVKDRCCTRGEQSPPATGLLGDRPMGHPEVARHRPQRDRRHTFSLQHVQDRLHCSS